MDDDFKIIYKILCALKNSLDVDDCDILSEISAERLGISETRRVKILQILLQAGYVSGIEICRSISGVFVVGKKSAYYIKGARISF